LQGLAVNHLDRGAELGGHQSYAGAGIHRLADAEFPPMTLGKIQAEVNAVRAARGADRHP
jgi:hypothetical protein